MPQAVVPNTTSGVNIPSRHPAVAPSRRLPLRRYTAPYRLYGAAMELTDVLRRRRMHRSFTDEAVDARVLDSILRSAVRAPSAGFTQGVDLLVLTTPEARARFWSLASEESWRAGEHAPGLLAAPVVVVPIADPGAYAARYGEPDKAGSGLAGRSPEKWPVPYWTVDASFVVMQLLLAVTDGALGALFFRLHGDPGALLEGLGAPRHRAVVGAVAIGHPACSGPGASAARRPRRPLAEVVHRERW